MVDFAERQTLIASIDNPSSVQSIPTLEIRTATLRNPRTHPESQELSCNSSPVLPLKQSWAEMFSRNDLFGNQGRTTMKRSFLQTAVVLSTILLVTGSRSFGDSKIRIGSGGGSSRSQAGNQGSQIGSLAGRLGNLNGGNGNRQGGSGNGGPGIGKLDGIAVSGGHNRPHDLIKVPHNGSNGNGLPSNILSQTPHSGRLGNFVKPDFRVTLPGNLQNELKHTILLPNGIKTKPIAIDAAQILKHKGPSSLVQPQIQQIMGSAPKHLCGHPKFSWWVNVCHDHCHTHYGCWNVHDHYWDCWTPCNWNVVQCQQFTYYVGLSCIYIPDMQAYGVQSVVNGSPAHLSGLQLGDLILSVNGQTVFDPNLINTEVPRGRLDLQVIRQGSPVPLMLTIFPRLVQSVSF